MLLTSPPARSPTASARSRSRRSAEPTRLRAARGRDALRRRRRAAPTATPSARSSSRPACRGYQESMTDPRFAGQIITFTYPHIGNYGVGAEAMESDRTWARAAIMREAHQHRGRARRRARLAATGWPTAASRRSPGSTRARSSATSATPARCAAASSRRAMPEARGARARSHAEPPMAGLDLARDVTPRELTVHGDGDGPRIAAIDTGIKALDRAQPRRARRASSSCTRARRAPTSCWPRDADAIFLANGPGDPAALGLHRRDRARARRQAAGVGHLPRPPAAVPGGRAWRRTSCPSATAAPTTRSRT